jgi:hypothetical protein
MSDENLDGVLNDSYLDHQRKAAIKNLGERTHLTLEQISKLVSHPKHGEIVKSITLDDLLAVTTPKVVVDDEENEETTTVTARPARKTTSKKKTPTKRAASSKKTTKKASKKKTTKKASSAGSRKADFGKKKPRLDYEQGMKEILAALKAAKEPCGRADLEKATGYPGVQVRTFCKKLAADGKIKILGKGGRSTRYSL